MIDENLEYIFNLAIRKANEKKHEYLTLENVLLALLHDASILEILNLCGADPDAFRTELSEFLEDDTNFSILSEDEVIELNNQQFQSEELKKKAEKNGIFYQPELSISLQRVIQRAALHVQSSGKENIKSINLLIAMYSEQESFGVYLLEKFNVTRLHVVETVAHGIDKPKTTADGSEAEPSSRPAEKGGEGKKTGQKTLNEFAENLNEQIRQGKIDPIIGRKDEIKRIIQTLCRRRKNNPLIVGEAGVGKTALVQGLAWAIEKDEVPDVLKKITIYSLDMVSLLAGTKFRGEFEERLKWVINDLKEINLKGNGSILFIDEIHTVIGAGATTSGSLDASNFLKPALVSGEIRCIGSTTFREYRKFMEKDQALLRRFQKIEIEEPSVEDTVKIIEGLRPKFELHHGVKYSSAVINLAVNLSHRYITDRKLPDKAIDVIDEVGAFIQIEKRKGKEKDRKPIQVSSQNVEEVVSIMAKIPKKSVNANEREKIKNLDKELRGLIFGQTEAIDRVVAAIELSRSGLVAPTRPLASFLFAGPTGVGKTELSKQLAALLGIHFERFDMSEYMEKHSVSKLIGAPPGYVGFDQGGKLTETIYKYPHCVLLLDEIEKAHPDIFNILLQVMDYGVLTDGNSRATDFKNVILVMTTNAGAQQSDAGSIGFGQGKTHDQFKREKVMRDFFSPEFRNRLDGIIHFGKLTIEHVELIVEKFLSELKGLLSEKKVELSVDREVYRWIGERGFNEKLGARPIGRMIDDQIKKVLSKEILFGKLEKGGKVRISVVDDNLDFDYFSK